MPYSFSGSGGGIQAKAEVSSRFQIGQSYATEAFNTAMDFLDSLKSAIDELQAIDTAIPYNWQNINFDPVLMDRPIYDIVDDIQIPSSIVAYTEEAYTSALLDALKNKLLNDIQNGGTGLSATIEQDIMDRESERDIIVNREVKDSVAFDWAERGFGLPNGILLHNLMVVETEYQNKRLDKSRTIAEQSEKIAIDNTQFIIKESNTLEATTMDYNSQARERILNSIRYALDRGMQIFDATIRKFVAKIEGYRGRSQAYEASARAAAAIADAEATIFRSKVQQATDRANILIQQLKISTDYFIAKANLFMEVARAGGSIASNLASGALAGINASASINSSASISESGSDNTSWNNDGTKGAEAGKTTSEIHYYQEK